MSESSVLIIGSGVKLSPKEIQDIDDGVNSHVYGQWKKDGNRYSYYTKFFTLFAKGEDVTIELSTETRENKVEALKRAAYFGTNNGKPDAIKIIVQHPFYRTIFIEERVVA